MLSKIVLQILCLYLYICQNRLTSIGQCVVIHMQYQGFIRLQMGNVSETIQELAYLVLVSLSMVTKTQIYFHLEFRTSKGYLNKYSFDNKKMTQKLITLKFHFLTLSSALRVGGFHNLGMIFTTKSENNYLLHFYKICKSQRHEQNSIVKYLDQSDDKDLCIFAALCGYKLFFSKYCKRIFKSSSTLFI